jgi:dUTPase
VISFAQTHPSAAGKKNLPTRATRGSVGLDLHMVEDMVLQPQETAHVDHQLTFRFPPHVYGQLHLRSSASKLGITLKAGVIGENIARWHLKTPAIYISLFQTMTTEVPSSQY